MTEKLVEARLEIDAGEWAHASARTKRQGYTSSGLGLRFIRRTELRKMVPLADTTIHEMERRGEFPRPFHLTSQCVAWDL
jgi:prophage regulatory protein